MCYDAKTSLSTFIIGSVFLLFLFVRNYQLDRFFVFVWIPIILIQLCEYFMWKDQKCGKANRISSICAFLLLKFQPLFVVLGVRFLSKSILPNKVLDIIVGIVSIFFIILVSITLLEKKNFQICSKPGLHKHLSWDHENLFKLSPKGIIWPYYYIYYLVLLLLPTLIPQSLGILYFIIYLASIVFTHYINYGKSDAWKSYWCHISNYLLVIPVIAGYLFKQK